MSRRPRDASAAVAPIFAALGDAKRLSLLSRLCDGRPQSISMLTQGSGLTRQGVTKHLLILERARVVSSERVGRESRFVIRAHALREASEYLQRASQQWDDAVERLKRFVEERD